MIGAPEFAIIVGLLALLLTVFTAAYILASGGRTARKPSWIAIVILLPVVGAILYFCKGRNPPEAESSCQ